VFGPGFMKNHIASDAVFKEWGKFKTVPHKNFVDQRVILLDKHKLLWKRVGTGVNTVISENSRYRIFVVIIKIYLFCNFN
jgi:hypothetical protein